MWVLGVIFSSGSFRDTWVRMGWIWVLAWIYPKCVLAHWSFEVGVGRLVVWLRLVIRCSSLGCSGLKGICA